MSFALLALSLLAAGDDAPRPRPAEVTGLLATRVRFPGAAGDRVAEAGLALLASCSYREHLNEGESPGWEDTLRDKLAKRHIRIRFPDPRAVSVMGRSIEVTEMLIVLPFGSGSVWVRQGDRAWRFAKWQYASQRLLEETLDHAEPAG